jgi:hypothetical protein
LVVTKQHRLFRGNRHSISLHMQNFSNITDHTNTVLIISKLDSFLDNLRSIFLSKIGICTRADKFLIISNITVKFLSIAFSSNNNQVSHLVHIS